MRFSAKYIVIFLSLSIVVLILLSIYAPNIYVENPEKYAFLPKLNAILNGISFISLSFSYGAIKNNQRKLHVLFILLALFLTIIFLISYLVFHFTSLPTHFSGTGLDRIIYLIILITHIIIAVAILPLVMFTILYAIQKNYFMHKLLARWTLPLWLYVSFTGMIIYLLNRHYY